MTSQELAAPVGHEPSSALMHANARLRAASERLQLPLVQLETFDRAQWTPALLDELYALAVSMSAEDKGHFLIHAHTNDAVHMFRQPDGAVVGFQFWRCTQGPHARQRVVLGGKLRILPAHRRRALHLFAGLVYYDAVRRAYPDHAIARLSIASLFGFVSIAGALASYQFIDGSLAPEDQWLCDAIAARAAENGYHFDRASGIIDVHIRPTDAQFAGYPQAFYDSPLARAYAARNPGYRTNGCNLAFAFTLSAENMAAIDAAIARRL